jgi:hypothetical protein
MEIDIEKLINAYVDWLKGEISIAKCGEHFEITSPYLDRNNDYLQIYVTQADNGAIYLTDDGYILSSLASEGMLITGSRKALLNSILRKYGVILSDNALTIKASIRDFPQKKHLLLQAMLTVDDMFMASQNRVASFFLEDIQEFFTQNDIFYTDNVQFTGTSGFIHTYDYVLQRSKTKPERLCRALNSPTKTNVTNILFGWEDTRTTRHDDSKLIVFVNDENKISSGVIESLENYDAATILWSERNQPGVIDQLSA